MCFRDWILVALFCQHKLLSWLFYLSQSPNLLIFCCIWKKKGRRRRHKVHCEEPIAAATCRCHGSVTQQASGRGDCYVLWVPVTQTASHKEKRGAGPLVNNSAKWIGWLQRRLSSAHARSANEALLGFSLNPGVISVSPLPLVSTAGAATSRLLRAARCTRFHSWACRSRSGFLGSTSRMLSWRWGLEEILSVLCSFSSWCLEHHCKLSHSQSEVCGPFRPPLLLKCLWREVLHSASLNKKTHLFAWNLCPVLVGSKATQKKIKDNEYVKPTVSILDKPAVFWRDGLDNCRPSSITSCALLLPFVFLSGASKVVKGGKRASASHYFTPEHPAAVTTAGEGGVHSRRRGNCMFKACSCCTLGKRENICWGYVTLGWSLLIALRREEKNPEWKTFDWMFVLTLAFYLNIPSVQKLPASLCVCLGV